MVVFPNAKINIGLYILGKRLDGFHNLQTVFYSLPFFDALEIAALPNLPNNTLEFSVLGDIPETNPGSNLCEKAYQLLSETYGPLPASQLLLLKHIPSGGGLGGGSADGAFTLNLLNRFYQLNIPSNELSNLALQLGSDCPFFLFNKPCLAEGRGEKLTPVSLDLSPFSICIINPGIHVSTQWAFQELPAFSPENVDPLAFLNHDVRSWKNYVRNDFEYPVFLRHPELAHIKNELYNSGAYFASLSGTGSTVYGIFEKEVKSLSPALMDQGYFIKWL
jgi:4-diphosphocytidyl-2-C-methyl-D-erythritol kinase